MASDEDVLKVFRAINGGGGGGGEEAPPPALRIIDPRDWTTPAPPRQWVVPDWVPMGVVTALYGDGGVGKSLLAQQLLNSVALALPWCGMPVRAGRALGIFCEDDEDELQRRQEAINQANGVGMENLENLRLISRFGFDNALIGFDGTHGSLSRFHGQIMGLVQSFRPALTVMDTAADLYPDNENDRSKVRQFIQMALGGVAREGCGVVLCAHPSASGLANGSGTGGSTAWSNTVRSRLYLSRGDEEDSDPAARILSRKKANYAPRDATVRLRWHDGALRLDTSTEGTDGLSWTTIGEIFDELQRAWDEGTPWSHRPETKRSGRYFPAFAKASHDVAEKLTVKLLSEWLMNHYLAFEERDSDTKMKGLRVLRRLSP